MATIRSDLESVFSACAEVVPPVVIEATLMEEYSPRARR